MVKTFQHIKVKQTMSFMAYIEGEQPKHTTALFSLCKTVLENGLGDCYCKTALGYSNLQLHSR